MEQLQLSWPGLFCPCHIFCDQAGHRVVKTVKKHCIKKGYSILHGSVICQLCLPHTFVDCGECGGRGKALIQTLSNSSETLFIVLKTLFIQGHFSLYSPQGCLDPWRWLGSDSLNSIIILLRFTVVSHSSRAQCQVLLDYNYDYATPILGKPTCPSSSSGKQ